MIIERMRELALEDYVAAGGAADDAPIVAPTSGEPSHGVMSR